jgi:hypothetical protein
VAALVGRHRDALRVLFDRRVDDLLHRAVVAQVHDLGAAGLGDAAEDVDRGIVPVEQARRGHQSDLVLRAERHRATAAG